MKSDPRPIYSEIFSAIRSDLFTLFPILAAYRIAVLHRLSNLDCLLAGVALALAFFGRQNTILFAGLPAGAILLARETVTRKARAISVILGGLILGTAVVLLSVMAVGDLSGCFHAVFVAPSQYSRGFPGLMQFFQRSGTNPLLPVLGGAAVLALFTRQRWFALGVLAVTLVVVAAPCRPYGHYWVQSFPAVAVLVFVVLSRETTPGYPDAVGIFLVGLLFVLINAGFTLWYLNTRGYRVSEYDPVAAEIDAHAADTDTLFAVGDYEAYLYFATRVRPAHKYFWPVWLVQDWSGVLPEDVAEVFREYRQSPPTLLVLRENVLEEVRAGRVQVPEEANLRDLIGYYLNTVGYREVGRSGSWVILRIRAQE